MIKYYKHANKKIKKYNPFIIAITGSCGKTSVKNYIYECLKNDYLIYKSPKSYNTLKGLTMTINKELKHYNAIFVLEMGLSHKNDIKKITKIFSPNISIITEILPSHLETMRTMDNIVREKMYIVKNMKEHGLIIINNDNELIRSNINKYNVKKNPIVKVGLEKNNDIYPEKIIVKKEGLEFNLIDNINKQSLNIQNNLIGRHNIYNTMITYCVIKGLNGKLNYLNELTNYENRLNIKKYNNITILNDGYNSNINGFISALEILSLYDKPKYIITPGIVEGGTESKKLNMDVAEKISEICDFCYIIDNKNTSFFIEKFNEKKYKNYIIKKDFFSAFNELKNKEIVLLIENDLTDFYYIK